MSVRFTAARYDQIALRLGYRFRDKAMLRHALTHASTRRKADDYERLEFLGDRVLGLVIAELLFRRNPGQREGDMSAGHSALVSGKTCAAAARALGLGDFIIMGESELTKGMNLSTNHSMVTDLGGAPSFSVGNNGWVVLGQAAPVVRGRLIRNAGAVGVAPDTVRDYNFGPSQPTKIVGGSITIRTWRNITATLRGEYQGGAYIDEDASYQALSRSVLWPTCFDAYNKQAANQPLTVAENLRCVPANVRSDMFIFPADFFKLRDLTIEVPLGRLIPRTSSSSFLFSAKNFYRRNYGMPMFDPEMSGNDGFNATVRYISEHIPAPATFTTSLRISF